jgi:hypothetical protein
MPRNGLGCYFNRDINERMEMGRYFGHTYNMPLYKIPAQGGLHGPHQSGESPHRHLLFDLVSDPRQENPLEDVALETHFCERIAANLHSCEAPAEQFLRLGLEPR